MKNVLDIDVDDEQGQTLTPTEHLESILFQFVNLYDRVSEDRQVTAKQGADIAKFIKEFSAQVKHFETIERFVRQEIRSGMDESNEMIRSSINRAAMEAIYDETSKAANEIRDAVYKAKALLSDYHASLKMTHWKMIGAMLVSSIVTSLLIVYFLMPKPVLPLSNDQMKYLDSGIMMNLVWPKLSKKEQDHWLQLAGSTSKDV